MQHPLVQANQWKANLQNKIGSSTDRPLLDFISQPAYLQDVAFGTKKLRLETGEEIVTSAAVRTVIPSRIIRQCQKCCKTSGFKPASERTLFRILRGVRSLPTKSLQGLDYITEGSQAHDSSVEIVRTLAEAGTSSEWGKEARESMTHLRHTSSRTIRRTWV